MNNEEKKAHEEYLELEKTKKEIEIKVLEKEIEILDLKIERSIIVNI